MNFSVPYIAIRGLKAFKNLKYFLELWNELGPKWVKVQMNGGAQTSWGPSESEAQMSQGPKWEMGPNMSCQIKKIFLWTPLLRSKYQGFVPFNWLTRNRVPPIIVKNHTIHMYNDIMDAVTSSPRQKKSFLIVTKIPTNTIFKFSDHVRAA